ncbi:hypothetical protein FRB90_011947 [Tulasnella sp. 427]|nr:hypothetical protein FRB90_011947 [Tulasnella sp. 427]
MPVDPRLLRLRLQRAGSSTNIAKAAKQAEQLAYQLPLENKCKDNTWKDLRASGLLEELALIISTPLPHRPSVTAHPERIDQAFLGSIDFESMLSIIVACIFEDTAAELDQPVISSGCQILSIYGKVRGFGNSTTSSTVKKYGARNMAEKCTTIIEFGPASIEKLVQTSALVHCLIFAESFKMEIIVHCGLHLKLMKRWWEAQRATVKKPLTEGLDQTLFFSDLQA